jgi:hypothetical protein
MQEEKNDEIKKANEKNEKHETQNGNYMAVGMCFGMSFGVMIASAFQISNLGYGMLAGLIVGMLIGMCIKRK